MGTLICMSAKKNAKVIIIGDSLQALVMSTAICKAVAEKIAKEKGVPLEEAIKFVGESIVEAERTLEDC